jgi:hypothetical protein
MRSPRAIRMSAPAINVRSLLHRLALHAAIFPAAHLTAAIRVLALLGVFCHHHSPWKIPLLPFDANPQPPVALPADRGRILNYFFPTSVNPAAFNFKLSAAISDVRTAFHRAINAAYSCSASVAAFICVIVGAKSLPLAAL